MEIVGCQPTVLLDAAHNPAGVTALCEALKNDFSYQRLILVFGVFRDKDYKTMIRKLAALADEIVVTSCMTERALAVEDLLPVARRYIKIVRAVAEPIDALRQALAAASADDLVCVTGSLYLIGEIKRDLPLLNTSRRLS
jgi:dihydrofolate synthase/folylpolyglutamate synthase